MIATLRVVAGPDRGKEYTLAEGEHLCGRDASNAVCLSDRTTSRSHFKVQVLPNRVLLIDLGSRNTTLVNGDPVREWRLRSGDRVAAGATEFEVTLLAPASPLEETDSKVEASLSEQGDPLSTLRYLKVPAEFERARAALAQFCAFASKAPAAPTDAKLFEALLDHVLRGTSGGRGFVALWDAAAKRLDPAASRDAAGKPLPETERPSASIGAQAVRENVSLLVSENSGVRATATGPQAGTPPPRSLLVAPLTGRDGPLGVIQVDVVAADRQFNEEDLRFVASLGHLAGLALSNLRMAEELRQENRTLREAVLSESGMVGTSPAIKQVLKFAQKAAAVDSAVLIRGESGTGKELVASAIHYSSPRKGRPFVCVNCGALPETLLESELFGHEKGAFTGADRRKIGRFEQADGGTLFLDEVGEMSPACQVKFLRVLETGMFLRVGGTEERRVDVRVLAATHRDLEEMIKAGKFREDLFFRLGVLLVRVPPLRERKDDVMALAEHFLAHFRAKVGRRVTGFSDAAKEALCNHPWPGNVRELKNAVERAVALGEGELIALEELPASVRRAPAPPGQTWPTLAQAEEDYIRKVLEHTGGNKSKAADILGIERSTLYKKLS